MSQRDLAARACSGVSYLDTIERGYCPPPSAPTITALACALGVDWDELFALGGNIPFDIIHLLLRSPLFVNWCAWVHSAATTKFGYSCGREAATSWAVSTPSKTV